MSKDLTIEELLLMKSRRDRALYHQKLFREFISTTIPDVYCIWTEEDWEKTISEHAEIMLYIDARSLHSIEQIIQLLANDPTQKKFVIDHISELTEKQFPIAQLFYHIIDQQEYTYNGVPIDFTNYTILMIQHDVENEYDDFYEYGRKKSVRL